MDFKFSKESGDSQHQEAPGDKKKQSALLVLLLILVGGFTYIYFFTGLIKSQEAHKPVEVPAAAPQIVKIPLPPRDGDSAKSEVDKAPDKAGNLKATVTVPVTAAKPAALPVKPAPVTATKPAPAPVKPKEELKKAEAIKPADKKPLPVSVPDKMAVKTVTAKSEEKKHSADKKSPPAKDSKRKPVSDDQAKAETVIKAKRISAGSWSVVAGNYVLEEALSADMGRVRKAGFEPIIKPSIRKKTAMNRLLVSEFNNRAAAQSTMEKLKHHTSDAFIIEQGGKFALYAGSYLQSDAANAEKERLKAAGISATLKHADIAIPSQSLSVGPFKSKQAAEVALDKLKSAGIKAALSQK